MTHWFAGAWTEPDVYASGELGMPPGRTGKGKQAPGEEGADARACYLDRVEALRARIAASLPLWSP